ncbi:uncharacterized protein TRAVEDRAFT_50503 [Trametes versicolor FP-101664 SS1]|uniref:uncharacterized protein n=1 Tax=Trametes versicolor (strain FP-101664) TaxID=717944 RepID=UPI0004621376|nr:uncharacterized protein TRAVEDRAFT_50503 [Trametes versicolor FP-101664 SS1]EIW56011.1 hypothetical protein TRAVEDRAFT_50503 [Trametes versicolor FP-101664 SS1]
MPLLFLSSFQEPLAEIFSGKPARMSTALVALAGLSTGILSNTLKPLSNLDSVFVSLSQLPTTVLARAKHVFNTTIADSPSRARELTLSQRYATQVTGIHMSQEVSAALCVTGALVLLCLSLALVLLRWSRFKLRLTEMLPPSLVDSSCDCDEFDFPDCRPVNVQQDAPLQTADTPVNPVEQSIPQYRADTPDSEPSTFPASMIKEEEHDDAEDFAQSHVTSQSLHRDIPHDWDDTSDSEPELEPPTSMIKEEEHDGAEDPAQSELAPQSSHWDHGLYHHSDARDDSCFDDARADDERIVLELLSKRTRTRPARRKGDSWSGKGRRYRDVKIDLSRDEALWQPGREESMGAARQFHRAFNAALPSGRVPASRR